MLKKAALVCPLLALTLILSGAPPAFALDPCVDITLSAKAGGRAVGTIVKPGEPIEYTAVDTNCGDVEFTHLRTRGHAPLSTTDTTDQSQACPNPEQDCTTYAPFQGPGIYATGTETVAEFQEDRLGSFGPGVSWIVKREVTVPDIPDEALPAQMCSHFHAEAFITQLQVLLPPELSTPDAGDNTLPDICFTVVPKVSDLSITKSDDNDPVQTGDNITYTLAVHNAGPDDDNAVVVTDTLPAGVTFVSASASQGGPSACSESSGTVTCNLGEMLPIGDATVTIVVTTTGAGTLTNSASVAGESDDNDPSNNSDSETTTVNPVADLSITKTDAPDPVTTGQSITYTLTAHNAGPDTDPGVTVTDTLPGNVIYVSSSSSPGSCAESGGTVTCDLGPLGVGSGNDATITINVTAAGAGTAVNSADISGSASDPDSSNNTASASTTVTAVADLSITKSDSADPVTVGDSFSYTLTAHNAGPDSDASVTVADTLPSSVTYVSSNPTQGSCTESGGIVTCSVGEVPPGAINDVVITISVTAASAGTASNSASVSGTAADPDSSNNSATETTEINPAPPTVTTVPFDVIEMSLNKTRPKKGGSPAAFVSTGTFDATQINPATICVGDPDNPCGGAQGVTKFQIKDVNGDGLNDLQFWFNAGALNVPPGNNVTIAGSATTFGGEAVQGTDTAKVI